MYRQKTIIAGPLVAQAIYPMATGSRGAVRSGRKKLSSDAQRRMNLKYAWQKLELLIAANFKRGDLWITLTYDDAHLPASRKEAAARVQAFFDRLRKLRRRKGQDLRYLYCTEHKHGDGRWHHHVLLNATGDDYDLIRKLWGQGGIEFIQIRIDRDKNFETLARYLCKEQRDKVGQRLWSGSRNLRKPERECFRVPNDTPLTPPADAMVLTDTGDVCTAYGHFRYIKYLGAGWTSAAKPKAKRRRRRTSRA